MNERSIFAQNLIRYRKYNNLTQEELAKLTGLTTRVIAHYETKATEPALSKIKKIADALNISPSALIAENENEKKLKTFGNIDIKTLKKAQLISKLTPQNRNTIYKMIDALLKSESKETTGRK